MKVFIGFMPGALVAGDDRVAVATAHDADGNRLGRDRLVDETQESRASSAKIEACRGLTDPEEWTTACAGIVEAGP